MLVIPDKSTIFILPPRTGSSTLVNSIMQAIPHSFLLYRHAEADAIPPGYETFQVMGFVRHPLARMWSLYKFLCCLDPLRSERWAQNEVMRLLESVQGKTFEEWVLTNEEPFLPENSGHPGLYQKHYQPETHKSQAVYLRPDLGTVILPFAQLGSWMENQGLPALHENNTTSKLPMPEMTKALNEHFNRCMEWELAMSLECV